jgi:di/tricarboxylate transporter
VVVKALLAFSSWRVVFLLAGCIAYGEALPNVSSLKTFGNMTVSTGHSA